jgi:hypothetical protein
MGNGVELLCVGLVPWDETVSGGRKRGVLSRTLAPACPHTAEALKLERAPIRTAYDYQRFARGGAADHLLTIIRCEDLLLPKPGEVEGNYDT